MITLPSIPSVEAIPGAVAGTPIKVEYGVYAVSYTHLRAHET